MNEMDKVDVLVATPLRLKSLIEKKRVSLSAVKYLVLDEADKLFEMGFVEQVDAAAAACDGPNVTRALFSATLPETVERLARSVMSAPMRLTVGERNAASETVRQSLVFVRPGTRETARAQAVVLRRRQAPGDCFRAIQGPREAVSARVTGRRVTSRVDPRGHV
jgi:superfamily II DNA/RNA helicase